jgi:hypothetical protein
MKKVFLLFCIFCVYLAANAQSRYWQQQVKYVMDVSVNVKANTIKGKQAITYTNNSPDTLHRIFIHLFWNAFKHNSMMDVQSRVADNLLLGTDVHGNKVYDADNHFKKKVADLAPGEEGYCNVIKFEYEGREQKTKLHETILEVDLDKEIIPGATVTFNTQFQAGIPKLSRRSGRDSDEGVRYSIGQWYPKISEYDNEGWHADDYTSREFYGVWGDYDVNITIDKEYKLGATGILRNASSIGWGYDKEGSVLKPVSGIERTWMFSAKNVHDFVWSADPEYVHMTRQAANGPLFHFIFKNDATSLEKWKATADTFVMVYPYMAKTFGPYPYPAYSFLQGGGGGTEYPMATLIKDAAFPTALHEFCHSWYQSMMGTNENLYPWMDEGFSNYAEARVFAWLHKKNFFEGAEEYGVYFNVARSRYDEPMSTPANFYNTNLSYNVNAYYKGSIFLRQLGYIVGEAAMDKILMEYYRLWKFKHPTPNDFVKVAEEVSQVQLQWYKQFMLYTIKTVDYSIDSLWEEGGVSKIRLRNKGDMPMPIDLALKFKDGSSEMHYVPLSLMYGSKPVENTIARMDHEAWRWVDPTYVITFRKKLADLRSVEIDPTNRLADVDGRNNLLEIK